MWEFKSSQHNNRKRIYKFQMSKKKRIKKA